MCPDLSIRALVVDFLNYMLAMGEVFM
ncbi:MAG: hypothetical protein H6620_11875 [Halobacteriovoraceae bacterium]|nr:hypothetical protein [Halobacteriovoraceae bacterium]